MRRAYLRVLLFCVLPLVWCQCNSATCSGCLAQRGCVWGADSCNRDCPYGFSCLGTVSTDRCPNLCDPDPCNGKGGCLSDGSCACTVGWGGWDCSIDLSQCNYDSDCDPGYCDNGSCKPRAEAGGRCTEGGSECMDGMSCMMQNARFGICIRLVQIGDQCERNEHCVPFYQRCVLQRCVDVTQQPALCFRSRDCPNNFPTQTMACNNNTCIYTPIAGAICRTDMDCSDEETCSAGRCWTNLASCRWDGDCSVYEQCKSATCIDPRSMTCRSWTDCVPASCVQGTCQSSQCDADWQCPAGSSCIASRCLVAQVCHASSDCLPGENCQSNSYQPLPYSSNQQGLLNVRRLLESQDFSVDLDNVGVLTRRHLLQTDQSYNAQSVRSRFSGVRTCRCTSLNCRAHGISCASSNDCDENFNCQAGVCLYQGFGTMWPTPYPTPRPYN